MIRSKLSYEMQSAANAALGAALEIEHLSRGKRRFPRGRRLLKDLAMMTKTLDQHGFKDTNDVALGQVFIELGHDEIKTVQDVQSLLRIYLSELRAIETFGAGDFDKAKNFCMKFNLALLDSYEHVEPQFFATI